MSSLHKMLAALTIFAIAWLTNCSSAKRTTSLNICEQQVFELIPTKDYISIPNKANTHVIFVQRQKANEFKHIRWVVMSINDCKVLAEQFFLPGYVKWKTNDEIELLDLPETVPLGKNTEDYIKTISIANLSKQL
ncbi:MAG: hypothetical protein ACKOE6_14210 [Flammeovirgaceae bacterium]